jgi:F-type H+-transporting ATPase subunit alpha
MSVDKQVMVIYLAVNGHLDDIDATRVRQMEGDFLNFVQSAHPEIGKSIADEMSISDKTKAKLDGAIEEFKRSFGEGQEA